jgi:methionyl-tRNA formyltransferase
MVAKPDAGRIVERLAVPILPDDRAIDVFRKVTVAAEIVMHRSLPSILDGTASLEPQDLSQGAYFGARKPEDGRIDWSRSAREIHDLVRAVAPPYPGAFTTIGRSTLRVLRTRVLDPLPGPASLRSPNKSGTPGGREPWLAIDNEGRFIAHCSDHVPLLILESELDGTPLSASSFVGRFGRDGVRPGDPQ